MNIKIFVGAILSSNRYGDFEIIERYDSSHFRIKFVKTGFEKDVSHTSIFKGEVRDPYFPIYYNVACLGNVDIKSNKRALNIWRFMIERCYNKSSDGYKLYGAKGTTVCEKWLCYENFLNDVPKIRGYDKKLFDEGKLELDKDISNYFCIGSEKQYSLENCQFVDYKINHQEMLARRKQHTSSKYVGVTKLKCGKWQASISYHSKNIYIGRFDTEKEAHIAYEEKKKELFGE